MPAIVPLTHPFTLSASVPTEDAPTSSRAICQMLVDLIARPLAVDLEAEGYTVGELEHIIYGSLVTFKEGAEPGRTVFVAQFPHPPGPDPDNTLFTVTAVTAELVGGVHDGLIREPKKSQRDLYLEEGIPYARTGYHLVDNHWVYQLVKTPATEETA